jgi:hypothetical protein
MQPIFRLTKLDSFRVEKVRVGIMQTSDSGLAREVAVEIPEDRAQRLRPKRR